ncbi:MAG: MBL fold metallo-hydrolase RNA specificity domain-containing protein [Acidimicrobiia bacterium]
MAPETTSVTFLGGVRTVTGSKFLVEHGGRRVLLDCGLFQGIKDLRVRNWSKFPVYPSSIDAVVLSHAHLDHCGYVPRLVVDGFGGPVHVTHDTAALTSIILPDSGHIQEEDAENANRYGWSRHEPALPLYTEDEARRSLERLQRHDFAAPFEVLPGIQVTFRRAGHILGSATVRIDFDNGTSVVASGDLGRPHHPLLVPPDPVGDADWILVESTYGDRRHDESAIDELADAIERTIARGGTVIIPSFAVDRTEVVMHHLRGLSEKGRLPPVPIYVDSPMALAALRVYKDAFANGSADVREEHIGEDPLRLDRLEEVHDADESRIVSELREPSIIIAASGMATGGRVVHHLAAALPDRRNTVILVGFQAEGTRGRHLAEGASELKMMGRYIRVRAEIVDLPAFSVHADADELVSWLGTAARAPETVFVVHGELQASRALQARVEQAYDWTAVVPNDGERVRLART